MSKFETRKKMLVAESEVYRQLLKLELQTFKVYGVRTKRRLSTFGAYAPLILSGLPILTRMFQRRKKHGISLGKIGSLFLVGWKAYKQFAPQFGRGKPETRERGSAAEEYLSNRL